MSLCGLIDMGTLPCVYLVGPDASRKVHYIRLVGRSTGGLNIRVVCVTGDLMWRLSWR
jgi:hypothetical protein